MRAFLRVAASWLAGRKTYLVAGLLVSATIAMVFFGRLTPTAASEMALFAISLFAVTFRSALQRHQQDVIEVLTLIAMAGKSAAAHKTAAAAEAAIQAAKQGAALASEIKGETSN